MKVTCEYCGNLFDDVLEKCPGCGAPNKNVRRSTSDQPTTIEDLQEWYKSKGLPPYETTRFFIGVDYREPKAFGIYKDEFSEHFIVYKNKADGNRAIRYEGTDEAYAVNELFMRLKQEILEQKANQISKNSSPIGNRGNNPNGSEKAPASEKKPKKRIMAIVFSFIALLLTVILVGFLVVPKICDEIEYQRYLNTIPHEGYYGYDDSVYYFTNGRLDWVQYDPGSGEWIQVEVKDEDELKYRKNADQYYLDYKWNSDLNVPDFFESVLYKDNETYLSEGYYNVDDKIYYFVPANVYNSYSDQWYRYDDDDSIWDEVSKEDLPDVFDHSSAIKDFWQTSNWDPSTQVSDFADTDYYAGNHPAIVTEDNSDNDDDSSWSSRDDDDDDDYSWSSSSDWDSGSTDWDSDW